MEDKVVCPKCGSDQITANTKGFSGGKAVAGAVLTGGIGLLAGLHGSSDIVVTCLKCGNTWNPKKLAEEKAKENTQKQITEYNNWKSSFYKAYNNHEFERASEIYLSLRKYSNTVPDVHAAYLFQKKDDKNWMIIKAVGVVLFLLVMVGIIKCIA